VDNKGDVTEVLAHNVKAVRTTDLQLVDVPGTLSLRERLGYHSVIPRITIPDVKQGDKIFLTSDPENEPGALPDAGVLTVDGIISTGKAYRQILVCSSTV